MRQANDPRSFEPKLPPPNSRSARGRIAEDAALRILAHRGYAVIDRNWRGGRGELDLVCRLGELMVFVEVRSRRAYHPGAAGGFGHVLECVRPDKLYRLRSAARAWLGAHPTARAGVSGYRFDLVALELARDGQVEQVHVIEDIST